MREIITLSVGQCGNQLNNKFWEQIAQEHAIETVGGTFQGQRDEQIAKAEVYFNQNLDNGRYVPRAVLVDLEPGVLNSIRGSQTMGQFFRPDNFIHADSGAGNNWTKGYFSEGAELVEEVLDSIRKEAESCESMQGFQMMHSLGGGTGSGLGSLLMEKLSEEYADKVLFNFSIFPGSASASTSDCVVEPYNSVLTMNSLIECSDATFTIDNSALYRICNNQLKIPQPSFGDINHIVSQAITNTTASLRFPGIANNSDIRKLCTNLIPFPRLHFLVTGHAPLTSRNTMAYDKLDVAQLTAQMFDARTLTTACDPRMGKILTASALYRGSGVTTGDVETQLQKMNDKRADNFVEWIPDRLMHSICKVAPTGMQSSGTFIGNTTAVQEPFSRMIANFDKMYNAKAYLHWYQGEGMDPQEMQECAMNMKDLISEYQQYEAMTVEEEEKYEEEDAMIEDDMEADVNMIDMSSVAGLAKQKSRNHDDQLSAQTTAASMSSFASPQK